MVTTPPTTPPEGNTGSLYVCELYCILVCDHAPIDYLAYRLGLNSNQQYNYF